MLSELKRAVLDANLALKELGLVKFTWGNVSGIDRNEGLVVIKPSGVPYEKMTADDMVVLDLDGNIIEGKLNPSSDMPTHLELYRACNDIGGVAHTHSVFATSFAQTRSAIPPFGTTHADCFFGAIPCTRPLTEKEVAGEYEKNTGRVILETIDCAEPLAVPAVLVAAHGPFTWGRDCSSAVMNAAYLEECARLAYHTLTLDKAASEAEKYLLIKHYERKHGDKAYYGQKEKK